MKRIAFLALFLMGLQSGAAVAAAPPGPAPGGSVPIGFSIVPGKPLLTGHIPANAPRSFSFIVAPGHQADDLVGVANPSTTTLTLRISTSDAITARMGGGMTFNDSRRQHDVGRWLALSGPKIMTVPAGKIRLVPLKLTVPSSTRPGEYEGTINGYNTQAQTVHLGKRTLRIHGSVRCLVYVRVTGRVTIGLRVASARVTRAYGHTLFVVTFRNTGTVIDHTGAPLLTFTATASSRPITLRPKPVGDIMGGDSTELPYIIDPTITPGSYGVSIQAAYQAYPDAGGQPVLHTISWSGTLTVPAS